MFHFCLLLIVCEVTRSVEIGSNGRSRSPDSPLIELLQYVIHLQFNYLIKLFNWYIFGNNFNKISKLSHKIIYFALIHPKRTLKACWKCLKAWPEGHLQELPKVLRGEICSELSAQETPYRKRGRIHIYCEYWIDVDITEELSLQSNNLACNAYYNMSRNHLYITWKKTIHSPPGRKHNFLSTILALILFPAYVLSSFYQSAEY